MTDTMPNESVEPESILDVADQCAETDHSPDERSPEPAESAPTAESDPPQAESTTPIEALQSATAEIESGAQQQAGDSALAVQQAAILSQLASLEDIATNITKRIELIPQNLHGMREKISMITESINEVRVQSMLKDLLVFHDLLDQIQTTLPPKQGEEDSIADHRHNYAVLQGQVRQTLLLNGLEEIDATGEFDGACHKAVSRVATPDESMNRTIKAVRRPGFRTKAQTLRYAEVEVWMYEPPTEEPAAETEDAG